VCVNTLTLFYSYGRGHQLDRTLHWIREVLLHRAYLDGTRYYATPECFLYFLGRLLETSNDVYLAAYLKPLLIERVQERIGAEGDALALSMRLCLCACLGLRNYVDLRIFLPLQRKDGSPCRVEGLPLWDYARASKRFKALTRNLKYLLVLLRSTLVRNPACDGMCCSVLDTIESLPICKCLASTKTFAIEVTSIPR
jgi:hypothetical protein